MQKLRIHFIFLVLHIFVPFVYPSQELPRCKNVYKMKTTFESIRCKSTLPENSNFTARLDVNRVRVDEYLPKIPVITTSTYGGSNGYNGEGLDIVVISKNSDALFTNRLKQQGYENISRPLYFPQFLNQPTSSLETIQIVISTIASGNIDFSLYVEFIDIDIKVGEKKNATITLTTKNEMMPAVWSFQNGHSKSRRIRVTTTSTADNCSIVALQGLNKPINIKETDITYESRWQTMLKKSVIDIDVGLDNMYSKGFVVVVVMKSNKKYCIGNDYDFSFDGKVHGVFLNGSEISTEISVDLEKPIQVEIKVIENDVLMPSLALLGLYVGLFATVLLLKLLCHIPITGTVSNSKKSKNELLNSLKSKLFTKNRSLFLTICKCFLNDKNGEGSESGELVDTVDNPSTETYKQPIEYVITGFRTTKSPNVTMEEGVNTISQIEDLTNSIHSTDNIDGRNTLEINPSLNEEQQRSSKNKKDNSVQKGSIQLRTGIGMGESVSNTNNSSDVVIDANEETNGMLSENAGSDINPETDEKSVSLQHQTESTVHMSNDNETVNGQMDVESPDLECTIRKTLVKFHPDYEFGIHRVHSRKERIRKRRKNDLKMDCTASKFGTVRMVSMNESDMFSDGRRMKSRLYFHILGLMGICYALPTGQLMLVAQRISYETGTEDICYYNYLCRYTTGWLDDYGHFYSNISYIFCGLLFCVLVRIRQKERRQAMIDMYKENNPGHQVEEEMERKKGHCLNFVLNWWSKMTCHTNVEHLNRVGVAEQYGIFYAMGGALILEGVLSASYHLCPVNESFQFDTTFMYIITALIYSKVYQFRHPDMTPRAYVIYWVIVVLLMFQVGGYYAPAGWKFLTFFVVTYFACMYILYHKMFFQGDRKFRKKLKKAPESQKVFCAMVAILNIGLGIFFFYHAWYKTSIVTKYLLVIFGANMGSYVFYYLCMKYYYVIVHKRRQEILTYVCCIYLILGLTFTGVGLYHFKSMERDSNISPSKSRELNQECTFWMFDKHDIWHFSSAFGLFLTFMVTLTMEDNNTDTKWEDIPVF